MPIVNSEMMNMHLVEISRHVRPGSHAVVLLDGAGWHTAADLRVPEGVVVVSLPAYTPELQPAEHLWPLVREGLANRVFDGLPKLTDALAARCRWLANHPTVVGGAVGFHWAIAA